MKVIKLKQYVTMVRKRNHKRQFIQGVVHDLNDVQNDTGEVDIIQMLRAVVKNIRPLLRSISETKQGQLDLKKARKHLSKINKPFLTAKP